MRENLFREKGFLALFPKTFEKCVYLNLFRKSFFAKLFSKKLAAGGARLS